MLILGSGSEAREDLLKKVGLTPSRVIPTYINEQQKKHEKPLEYVKRMAAEKAEAINTSRGQFLITADTIVLVGRKILHKTDDINEAKINLKTLSGRRHKVITAFCVKNGDKIKAETANTILKMKNLSDDELENYIALNEWKGKAGSYSIQGRAITFFPFISGCFSNVIGLPLPKLFAVLRSMGF